MKTFEILISALSDLNELLSENDTTVDLTIVGSMAIHLNGLNLERMTEDIDYINYSPTLIFQEYTQRIAKKYDLPPDWINSRAQDIEPLPDEIQKKLKRDERFSHINLKFIDIDTAIQMKVYAYYVRGLEKDLSDLRVLRPSKRQLESGVDYIKKQLRHHHGKSQLDKDKDEINKLLEFLKNELK